MDKSKFLSSISELEFDDSGRLIRVKGVIGSFVSRSTEDMQ